MIINKKAGFIFILFLVIFPLFSHSSNGEEDLENLCLSLNDPEQYEQSLLKLKEIYKTTDDQSKKDEVENIFFDLLKTLNPEESLRILSFLSREKGPDERIKKGLLSLLEKTNNNNLLMYSTMILIQKEKLNMDEMKSLVELAPKKFISLSGEIKNRKLLEMFYETIAISGRESAYDIIMDSLKKEPAISTALHDSLGNILASTGVKDSHGVMIQELEEWYKRDPRKIIQLIREGTPFLQHLAKSEGEDINKELIQRWMKTLDDILRYEERNNDARIAASEELNKLALLFPSFIPQNTSINRISDLPQQPVTKEDIQSLPEYKELRDKYLDTASVYKTREMVLKMYYSMNPKDKLIGRTILEEGISSKNKTVKAISLNPPLTVEKSDYMKNLLMEIILYDDDRTLVHSATTAIMNQFVTREDSQILFERIKEIKQKAIFDKYSQRGIFNNILKAVAHNAGKESYHYIMEFLNKNPKIDAVIKSNKYLIVSITGHPDAITFIMDDITTPLLGSYMEVNSILSTISMGFSYMINNKSCSREEFLSLGRRYFGILNDLAIDETRAADVRIVSCRYLAILGTYDDELERITDPVLLRLKPLWKASPGGDKITKIIEGPR